jgi:eukaryotic-like serine/threonine-protein kinase
MSVHEDKRSNDTTRTALCTSPLPIDKSIQAGKAVHLAPGAMLDRYRIEEELGQGQGGIVYRAFDTAIERIVALKCLRTPNTEVTDPKKDVHFEEARVIGQLHHPHITTVFDMGNAGSVAYIVMEYVQGETLMKRLAQTRSDPASVPQVLNFIVMVARALHYVHQRGILHGDIKPANLIVTPQGTPKIMDFGVSRRTQARKLSSWSLATGELIWGTPAYLAPEQLDSNAIDARADVFSLGVVAYEWLTGRKPFWGENVVAIQHALLHSRPPSLTELGDFHPELSATIDQALARDPAQRFDSADAMADALEICHERSLHQLSNHNQPAAEGSAQFKAFPRLKDRNLLFADFSESDFASVMQVSRQESYKAGDTILQEGSGGSTMYVVISGRASVRKTSERKQVEIKRVSKGECFGEMAIISQMPRSATVVALQPTEVLAISGAVLRSVNQGLCMKLYRNIASLLADRVRQRDEQVVDLLGNDSGKKRVKHLFPFW